MKPRGFVVAVLLVCAAACRESSPGKIVGSADPAPSNEPTVIEVTVGVDGVVEYARKAYGIALDGHHFITIGTEVPTPLIVAGGTHTVAVETNSDALSFVNFNNDWCRPAGPASVTRTFAPGETQQVRFTINCPEFAANAKLVISVVAGGVNVPDSISFNLTRDALPRYSRAVTTKVGDVANVDLPSGPYVVSSATPNCPVSSNGSRAEAHTMAFANQTARAVIVVACS